MTPEQKPTLKKEALLHAAISVFAECGYQKATIEQIAKRAGVGKGTAYLYFEDKSDLFFAVFERWSNETMAASAQSAGQAKTAREALTGIALGAADFIETHKDWFPLTMEAWSAGSTPELRERFSSALQAIYAQYRLKVSQLIKLGQNRGEWRSDLDAESLAALLTGAVDGLFLQCWFDPSLNAKTMLVNFFDVLERGMRHPDETKEH